MNHHHADHERSCEQCGINYHSPRASSRFCSIRCQKRHQRGLPKEDSKTASTLRAWLAKRGLVCELADGRLGLNTPLAFALEELNEAVASVKARGLKARLPVFSEEEFRAALKAARIAQ